MPEKLTPNFEDYLDWEHIKQTSQYKHFQKISFREAILDKLYPEESKIITDHSDEYNDTWSELMKLEAPEDFVEFAKNQGTSIDKDEIIKKIGDDYPGLLKFSSQFKPTIEKAWDDLAKDGSQSEEEINKILEEADRDLPDETIN